MLMNKMFLVDTTNLSVEQQVKDALRLLMR